MAKKNIAAPLDFNTALSLVLEQIADNKHRGLVLICGAVLDRALEKSIRAKLNSLSSGAENDIDFLLSAPPLPPLRSASLRTRCAHVLGLIDNKTRDVLIKIFEMRNKFAHEEVPPPLENFTQSIYDTLPPASRQIAAFMIEDGKAKKGGKPSPKAMLQLCIALLLAEINRTIPKCPAST